MTKGRSAIAWGQRDGEGWQERVAKGHGETCGDGGYVHAPEHGDDFAGIYTYQNLNRTFKIHALITCLLFLNKALSDC